MPIKMKRLYLDTIRERYKNAPKVEKTIILNEFCRNCPYSRKYAIRILHAKVEPRLSRPGPKPKYDDEVIEHLKALWEAMNRMCSKKMVVALPLWLNFYRGATASVKEQLVSMSASTIDRRLAVYRRPLRKGLSTTTPSMVKSRIPIKLLDHEVREPGFIEADTVAHCGDNGGGTFVSSLTMTDLNSGWTENRAVLTKVARGIVDLVGKIERDLPFNLQGFACDSGSEFINEELESFLRHRVPAVEFVRRRPYKKNDNAHVEQKNFTHVRELFGYERFEEASDVVAMNEIYRAYWNPLWNYFTPVMKLVSKTRVGGKLIKKYDRPKTPYQRLLDHPKVSYVTKRKLRQMFETKNPFFLKQALDKKLQEFFKNVERRKIVKTGS
jgi:hypothetical protein